MSRIGKNPVIIPPGVKVSLSDGILTVKGPKGQLTTRIHRDVTVTVTAEDVTVTRPSDVKLHRALHGTTRANIQNMVVGVTEGYAKNLEMVGVGYKAELIGRNLVLSIGFSHQVAFVPPAGVEFTVTAATAFSVSGIDKQLVGQMAAKVRSIRPPEPYKGKGIKYANEYVRRKAGKTAKA